MTTAPLPGAAEMSASDYEAGSQRLSPAQRAQEAERMRQERERAEAAEREREALAEQARREDEARLAARPPGVRLVEARCGACHGPEYLRERRYGWLGWWTVLLRMEFINGARFDPGERRVIVAHLAESHSAGALRVGLEWGAAAVVAGLVIAAGRRLQRARH